MTDENKQTFTAAVAATAAKHAMFHPGCRAAVGLSGGGDSVCLLHTLHYLRGELGITLCAAHLNHGIRGDEADADEQFSRELAASLGIEFYSEKIDIPSMHKPGGPSVEQLCRRERHAFFKRAMSTFGATRLALAHTATDQAETVLMRVLRGTSPRGLTAMRHVNAHIVRPLLDFSREEIQTQLKRNDLAFREDSTNSHTIYFRNRVRNELVPLLQREFNPAVRDALNSLARLSAVDSDFLESLAGRAVAEAEIEKGQGGVKLSLEPLAALHDAVLSRVLAGAYYEAAGVDRGAWLTAGHIEEMMEAARDGRAGMRVSLPGGLELQKGYGDITIRRASQTEAQDYEYTITVPPQGETVSLDIPEAGMTITVRVVEQAPDSAFSNDDEFNVYIDAEAAGAELTARNRRDGDSFIPLGMTGTKKLHDYFVDEKIPAGRRDTIPLLLSGGNICWVAGMRIDERFKCMRGKRRALELKAVDSDSQ